MLAAIVAFSFCTKLPRLGTPSDFYFDETYHGFTAVSYLHGEAAAYDPWAKNPPHRAYEWTHPPLAKLIMAGTMAVTGEDAFGWRLGSVVFGTGAIAMTALLALELFGSQAVALLAAFFLSIEGLAFAQSRIAMNDAYFLFFALSTFFFYVRWRKTPVLRDLYATGAFLGLALATKWTALYVIVILAVDLFKWRFWDSGRKEPVSPVHVGLALLALPVALYLASYIQFFMTWDKPGAFDRFITLQQQMWWYHSGLKATHPYQSKPWQWIFNLRPVWMFAAPGANGTSANIYNDGNSVILIGGLIAFCSTLFREKAMPAASWSRGFLLFSYCMLWMPWIFSPRIMLFYHYLPAVPLLCILLARKLVIGVERSPREGKRLLVGTVAASVVWFVVFYPNLTGIFVPNGLVENVYRLLPGWR